MNRAADGWIRRTATGCVALLALIAGIVSYLHMHQLVELHGQPGWVVALTPLSVDGMIAAASTTLLADSRAGSGAGYCRGRSGGEQYGELGCQCRGRPADSRRAGDRALAVVRANRRLRAADAPGPPQRGKRGQAAIAKARAGGVPSGDWRSGVQRSRARRPGPGPAGAGGVGHELLPPGSRAVPARTRP